MKSFGGHASSIIEWISGGNEVKSGNDMMNGSKGTGALNNWNLARNNRSRICFNVSFISGLTSGSRFDDMTVIYVEFHLHRRRSAIF